MTQPPSPVVASPERCLAITRVGCGADVTLTAVRRRRSAVAETSPAVGLPLAASAVADVHDRRGRELFGLCRRLGLDEDESNDAVQEAFLRMWAESKRGTSSSTQTPGRSGSRTVWPWTTIASVGACGPWSIGCLPSARGPSLDPTDRLAVWAEVDRLPPRQRAVIYLRYRADLPVRADRRRSWASPRTAPGTTRARRRLPCAGTT